MSDLLSPRDLLESLISSAAVVGIGKGGGRGVDVGGAWRASIEGGGFGFDELWLLLLHQEVIHCWLVLASDQPQLS